MRIALIPPSTNPCPPLGYGGEVYPANLAWAWSKLGHTVEIYAPPGSMVPENGALCECPWSRTYWPHLIEEQIYFSYQDRLKQADVVADMSHTHRIAGLLREQGYDRVVSTHFGHVWLAPWEPYNMVTGCRAWHDASAAGVDEWGHTEEAFRKWESVVIPWATDTQLYHPTDYVKRPYCFWLCRIRPEKGIAQYLDVAARHPATTFLFSGSLEFPDHKAMGKEYVLQARGMPNVEFVSIPVTPLHQVLKARLLREAAVMIANPHGEAFGLYIIEALASGTPVIGRAVGSLPEIIEHGKTGFLFRDDRELEWALQHIGEIDPTRCREEALVRFDRMRAAEEYILLFKDVIAGRRW